MPLSSFLYPLINECFEVSLLIVCGLVLIFILRIVGFDRRQQMTATIYRSRPITFHRFQGVCPLRLRPSFMIALIIAYSTMLKESHLLNKYHNILILNLSVDYTHHFFTFQPTLTPHINYRTTW